MSIPQLHSLKLYYEHVEGIPLLQAPLLLLGCRVIPKGRIDNVENRPIKATYLHIRHIQESKYEIAHGYVGVSSGW